MLAGQQANFCGPAAIAKLRAIGVPLPAHPAKEIPIPQMKCDEIATTAMIGPENKSSRLQVGKGMFDIDRSKTGTVAPDYDNFVVAKLIKFLDGILQARREIMSGLPMDSGSAPYSAVAGGKKVNVYSRRKFRAEFRETQEWLGRTREGTSRKIDVGFVGKNQDGTAGHAFWI